MEFYGSLVNSTEAIQQFTGLNLEEILSIPTGELAVALLPSDQMQARARARRNEQGDEEVRVELSQPSVAVMMDAGEEIAGVQVLLQRMQEQLPESLQHDETKLGMLTLHQYSNPDKIEEQFGYFVDQGVFVGCSNLTALERLAKRWLGQQVDWPSLAENRQFTSIMGRCVGTQGERPHASFFVDPLALIRQLSPPSTTSTMVFALLPSLGLNDIQAIGGSIILSPPDFDSINHFHVFAGQSASCDTRPIASQGWIDHAGSLGASQHSQFTRRSTGMRLRRSKVSSDCTISSKAMTPCSATSSIV